MEYVARKPGRPLDTLVDCLWMLTDAPGHSHERIVPAGTFELVVNLAQDEIRIYGEDGAVRRHRGAVLSGAFSRSFIADTREHAAILGVRFKPGAARAFIGTGADRLADSHVALADLWSPAESDSLRDALCSSAGPSERFAVMESALRDRLVLSSAAPRLVNALLSRPDRSISDTAVALGLSHRSFIRSFAAEVGLTPKLFLRIRRFTRAFELAQSACGIPWAQLASDCGYYDQSHLIRDFAEFADVTPAAFARLPAELVKPDHIAIG